MKTAIKTALMTVLIAAISYLCMAFLTAELNPAFWGGSLRFITLLIAIAGNVSYHLDFNNKY